MNPVDGNTEAIALLKAFLSLFRSDIGEVLEAVAFKILQIQEWLEETQLGYIRQLKFCQEAILQAHAHDPPEEDARSDAYRQFKEAQEQFDNFLSWKQKIEEAILEYQQQAVLMKAQLEDDVTKAKLFLEERISKLKEYEEYFATSLPALGMTATVIPIRQKVTGGTVEKDWSKETLERFIRPLTVDWQKQFGSHVGICSGRPFFPEKLKLPLQELSTAGVKITPEGVAKVKEHVERFDPYVPNERMLDRLNKILRGIIPPTSYDVNFYTHEIREFQHYESLGYKVGIPEDPDLAHDLWNNTHTATLEEYGLADKDLFHPTTEDK
jgi:hypothetical protein